MLRCAVFLFLSVSMAAAKDPYRHQWIAVSDRLIQTSPDTFPYNWGEGVQLIGLMRVYERTGDPRYLDWMKRWAALWAGKDPAELLNIGGKPGSKDRKAYCGHWSPATAILLLNRAAPDAAYRKIVAATADFIGGGAERSPEGGLGHWQGSHQLWVDTLYMACPPLAGWGKETARPELVHDAASQILVYARHLQDAKTGLFYHMWDWQTGERTPGPWGRGNGWVIMSIADTLEVLDRKHPSSVAVQGVFGKMMQGLKATQDPSGLWHTVLDDKASYVECSATSMIVYGVLKLARLGLLPRAEAAMARQAWRAVNEQFVKDGLVTGVSAGTVPKGRDYYSKLPAGTKTWGTGAYLLVGSEMDRLPD